MYTLKTAFSPCPNDTFLFHAWHKKKISSTLDLSVSFGDVEELNQKALSSTYDLSKLSAFSYGLVHDQYDLLPCGAALGFHCGPKLITKDPLSLDRLSEITVAVPGKYTTAHFLLQHFFPEVQSKIFCTYEQVEDLLNQGKAQAGLIIHETRFTFEKRGFLALCDLGELWHERYQLPLPLGVFVLKKELSFLLKEVVHSMKSSLKYAWDHPKDSASYVKDYSIEKTGSVIKSHIDLYVNQESYELSTKGKEALNLLFSLAYEQKLYTSPVPALEQETLISL